MSQVSFRPKHESFSSFTRLPPELQTIILQYALISDPSDYLTYLGNGEPDRAPLESKRELFKQIRLVSHVFHNAVTFAVFASIHLHASDLSMARAEMIANSRHAGHVKEIVYHEGSFANRNCDKNLFFSTLASNRRRQDYPAELKAADKNKLYKNFVEEVEAADRFPAGKSGNFPEYPMRELTRKLPHLLTYVSLPYHDEWHDPETSAYTLRRTGLSYLPQPSSTLSGFQETDDNFIRSMAHFEIRKLNLALFPTNSLQAIIRSLPYLQGRKSREQSASSDPTLEQAEKSFSELKCLKIGPAYGAKYGYGVGMGEELHEDTTVLLQAALNLTHLELTNDYPLSRKFTVLPRNKLPKLETLVVSRGMTLGNWPEKALAQCISNVGVSLKHLHFDSIVVKDWSHGSEDVLLDARAYDIADVSHGSLVRLLYNITSSTNLKSCTGLETVEDLKSRAHSRNNDSRPGCKPGKKVLVDKLERAVCHHLQWPVDMHLAEPSHEGSAKEGTKDIRRATVLAFIGNYWDDTIDEFALREREG